MKKIVKNFQITEVQQQMIDEIRSKWGIASEAEVFRSAIMEFYQKKNPPYLRLSPVMEEKQRALENRRKTERLSDTSFAQDVLRAFVGTDQAGKTWAVIHTWANMLRAIPIEDVRSFAEQNEEELDLHSRTLSERSVEESISEGTLRGSGVVLPFASGASVSGVGSVDDSVSSNLLKTPEEIIPNSGSERVN